MSKKTKQRKGDDSKPRHQFKPGNSHGKRWQPGESGNPAGRPVTSALRVTSNFSAAVREFLNEPDCAKPDSKTRLRVLLELGCRRAKQGSGRDLQTLLAYAFGSPTQMNVNLNSELSREEQLRSMSDEELNAAITEKLERLKGSVN